MDSRTSRGQEGGGILVLTRRDGEALVIDDTRTGEPIEVTVKVVRKAQVRIGVRAPQGVRVDWAEIFEHRQREATERHEGYGR